MTLKSEKFSIFEAMEGCHDNRFVAFNHEPENHSKFKSRGMVDLGIMEGRGKVTTLNPEPHDFMPDYVIKADNVSLNLRLGSVDFKS